MSVAALLLSFTAVCQADGIIRSVPDDGTAAVFQFHQHGTMLVGGVRNEFSVDGTSRIAVVGSKSVAGLTCRWIEIEDRHTIKFGEAEHQQASLWKILVPERELTASGALLPMVFRIYATRELNEKEPRLVTRLDDRRMTLNALRSYFPGVPTPRNRIRAVVKDRSVVTPAGQFSCEVHVFDSYHDAYLMGPSRSQQGSVHRLWVNEESPFGVVAMENQTLAQEVSMPQGDYAEDDYRLHGGNFNFISTWKLIRVERGAKSRFPELD